MSTPISIVAVPKPFHGHIATIQRNALGSWTRAPGVAEVILLGDEAGTAEAARAANAVHVPRVALDDEGRPRLDDVFRVAQRTASSAWISYVNADIVLLPALMEAASTAMVALGRALLVSRRWNLDVAGSVAFSPGWDERLRTRALSDGELFTPFGIDVFLYPKGMFLDMPPFTLGALSWDNWLIHEARTSGCPVVDLTEAASVIHQNHDRGKPASTRSPQSMRNFWLAGDTLHGLSSVRDATHVLRDGAIVPADTPTVSVVVTDTGRPDRLHACLSAFVQQTHPRTYTEVIVAQEAGRRSNGEVLLDFPFVKRARATHPGRGAARNKGAAVASGDVLAFLDADVMPAGDWIEQALATPSAGAERWLVASTARPRLPDRGSTAVRAYGALTLRERHDAAAGAQVSFGDGAMMPRAVWREVGSFADELRDAAVAEWDWTARALARDVRIMTAPAATVTTTVGRTWRELTADVRRRVRRDIRLSRLQEDGSFRTRGERWSHYTRQLVHEARTGMRDPRLAGPARLGVLSAAAWAWLVRLDESMQEPDVAVPRRCRAGPDGRQ